MAISLETRTANALHVGILIRVSDALGNLALIIGSERLGLLLTPNLQER